LALLVQALSQALLALRRAAAASSGRVELLVGPFLDTSEPSPRPFET